LLRDVNESWVPSVTESAETKAADLTAMPYLEAIGASQAALSAAPGETILEPGNPGNAMFVVLDGQVEVRHMKSGVAVIAGAGDVFGELALCGGQGDDVMASAITDARIIRIDELRFRRIVENNPGFAIAVIQIMARRMLSKLDAL
jgi:CRP-like cAMP-binding protein